MEKRMTYLSLGIFVVLTAMYSNDTISLDLVIICQIALCAYLLAFMIGQNQVIANELKKINERRKPEAQNRSEVQKPRSSVPAPKFSDSVPNIRH